VNKRAPAERDRSGAQDVPVKNHHCNRVFFLGQRSVIKANSLSKKSNENLTLRKMVCYAWWRFVSSDGKKNIFYIIRSGEPEQSFQQALHKGPAPALSPGSLLSTLMQLSTSDFKSNSRFTSLIKTVNLKRRNNCVLSKDQSS
jgi:hypothetical protein